MSTSSMVPENAAASAPQPPAAYESGRSARPVWITWDHRLAALLKAAVRVGVNVPKNWSELLNGSP